MGGAEDDVDEEEDGPPTETAVVVDEEEDEPPAETVKALPVDEVPNKPAEEADDGGSIMEKESVAPVDA